VQLTEAQRAIHERAQTLAQQEQELADRIIEMNRQSGLEAMEAGVIKNTIDNYTARLWDLEGKTPEEAIDAKFKTRTGRAKPRTLESIPQGWALGLNLRIKSATGAQHAARTQVAQVIEDRNLLTMAEKAGLISTSQTSATPKRIEHPNFTKWDWVGKAEEGKTYGRNIFIDEEGNIFQKMPYYADPILVKKLNKILGRSLLYKAPGFESAITAVTKWNDIIKQLILSTMLFHHQAFMRSSMLGSQSANLPEAYRDGWQAYMNWTPEVIDGVRAGLTIGKVAEWDEAAIQEKTRIGEAIDKVPMAAGTKAWLLELRDRNTDFLFKRLGPALKVQAFLLEYRSLIKKHEAQLEAGTKTRHELAKIAADLANDDFGGLHLGRMERDPTVQHLMKLFLLAPDWTESNVRSMVKAFQRGETGQVYRAFWARIALKGLGAVILGNLLLAGFDDDDFWTRSQRAWKTGNLRWLDIDVTPIYRALSGEDEKRKYFSLIGHFRDPLKFILHPFRSFKHKSSVLGRIAADAAWGADWAGRPFTTWAELLGVDDKGVYKAGERAGLPKGGKLRGRLVQKQRGAWRPISYETLPSFLLYEARQSLPIPIQQGIGWLAGELDAFDALTKSVGMMTATTYRGTPERSLEEALEENDPARAKGALERLGEEEGQESRSKLIALQAHKLAERRPERKVAREAWQGQLAEARQWFSILGLERKEVLSAYWQYLLSRYKTPKTRRAYYGRLNRELASLE
jgi:hypothetical protein